MPYLFSYGTLQLNQVQIETFGRVLEGEIDSLLGYEKQMVEITDPIVLKTSGKRFHPIVVFTNSPKQKIEGILFEVTEFEILRADEYEVDDYARIETIFESGKKGFIYIKK